MNYRNLIIIRHSKSSWDNPKLDDHDRPLNERGMANAPEMSSRLKNLNVNPEQLDSAQNKTPIHLASHLNLSPDC